MCVSIQYSRHEAFSCTTSLSKKLVNWQNSTQYPKLGPTASRIVGFITLPFATIADISIHLSFVVAKTMTGIFITPYNFIATCINPAYKAPREWELHSAFIHLAQALIHLSSMPFLPLINLASPEWCSSCMKKTPFQLTQKTIEISPTVSHLSEKTPPQTPQKRTLNHDGSFTGMHGSFNPFKTPTPPAGASTPNASQPFSLYYSASPGEKNSTSISRRSPIKFNLDEISTEEDEMQKTEKSVFDEIDSLMDEIIQECNLSMSEAKGILPPPIVIKQTTDVEEKAHFKDPIPGLSRKINLTFNKCFYSLLGQKNPVYLSGIKIKLDLAIEKWNKLINDSFNTSATKNPKLDISTEDLNDFSFLNDTAKEVFLTSNEEVNKKILEQLLNFQQKITFEENKLKSEATKLKQAKESSKDSSEISSPSRTKRRHSFLPTRIKTDEIYSMDPRNLEELREDSILKINPLLGKNAQAAYLVDAKGNLKGKCNLSISSYYDQPGKNRNQTKFNFETLCKEQQALISTLRQCSDKETVETIQSSPRFKQVEDLLAFLKQQLR